MEFAIEREEFIRGLSRVQSIIEKRTTLPILSNVLLETKENGLQIVGTDLEVGIKGLFSAKIKDPGSITVPAKKLFEIIRELPEGEVLFKVVENDWVTINAGQAHFKLMGLVPDDFPILPDYEEETFFKLPTETLANLIEMVGHAIGSDETRPYLNGLFVHTVENGGKNFLRTVATDGHRLALSERELPEGEKIKVQPGVIIPKKGISELKKALDGDGDTILIAFTERNTIIKTGNMLFIIRLIDGDFPDYDSVVPKNNDKILTCSRDELFSALRRVSLLSEELGRGVKFELGKKSLKISCENPNLGEAHEEMAVTFDGDAFDIGFNARYFLDTLSTVKDEDVHLAFCDAFSSVLIKVPSEPGFLSVIMPMRL